VDERLADVAVRYNARSAPHRQVQTQHAINVPAGTERPGISY